MNKARSMSWIMLGLLMIGALSAFTLRGEAQSAPVRQAQGCDVEDDDAAEAAAAPEVDDNDVQCGDQNEDVDDADDANEAKGLNEADDPNGPDDSSLACNLDDSSATEAALDVDDECGSQVEEVDQAVK